MASFFSYLKDRENASIHHIFARDRDRFGGLGKTGHNIMRRKSRLTHKDRELLAAFVSGTNQCNFCHTTHVAFAKAQGVDPDLWGPLLDDIDTASVDEKLKPILRYCRKLTLTPYKITKQDYDEVMEAGWDEGTLDDAIAVTCLFNFYNRLVDGHGLSPTSPESLVAAAEMVRQAGYSGPAIAWYWIRKSIRRRLGLERPIRRSPSQ